MAPYPAFRNNVRFSQESSKTKMPSSSIRILRRSWRCPRRHQALWDLDGVNADSCPWQNDIRTGCSRIQVNIEPGRATPARRISRKLHSPRGSHILNETTYHPRHSMSTVLSRHFLRLAIKRLFFCQKLLLVQETTLGEQYQ
ncbi:hypothetical protein HPP92_019324 [Vanilla planifolia]|uniref:Uncharacterized protein n=1 Tax=Vanilla planifolia TaxID=51239 RepID=A0A835ULK5_VANPL|nr:hypothetical protein HPP92_019324 [Vanilla planifolia]